MTADPASIFLPQTASVPRVGRRARSGRRFGIRCTSPFAGECDETRRLAFLASRLRTAGTPIESWKLLLATEQRRID